MARKKLLYYLFSSKRLPFYVNDAGQVVEGDDNYNKANGQPAHLTDSPEGWTDTLVKFGRNQKWWGLFRSFTLAMVFHNDGWKILSRVMWSDGYEGIVYMGIKRLDPIETPYIYKPWYISEMNLNKWNENNVGVTTEALEGGLSKAIKAAESTVQEFDMASDPEVVNVKMDGIIFDQHSHWTVFDDQSLTGFGQHTLEILNISTESLDSILSTDEHRRHFISNGDLVANSSPFLRISVIDSEVTIKWKFGVTVSLAPGISANPLAGSKLFVRIANEAGTIIQSEELQAYGGAGDLYQHHSLSGEHTFTAPARSRLYLVMVFTISGGIVQGGSADEVVKWIYDQASDDSIDAYYTYRHPTTYVLGFKAKHVLELLINKISGGTSTVASNWLTNVRNDIVLTSGDAIRGIANPKFKISLDDFFKGFNRWGAGMGVESSGVQIDNDVLRFENLRYFFNSTVIVNIGQVTDATCVSAEDLFFNTITAGYKTQTYTDVNGKREFNQGQKWTAPVKNTIKDFDVVSPIRADALGMELLRVNLDNKTTTDSSSDNDPFFLNVEKTPISINTEAGFLATNTIFLPVGLPLLVGQKIQITGSVSNDGIYTIEGIASSFFFNIVTVSGTITTEPSVAVTITPITNGVYRLYRPAYSSVDGLPHWETWFNLELSPHKSLISDDLGGYIHSVMDIMGIRRIVFNTGDKNTDLVTILNGVAVAERQSIQIGGLPARMFRPFYLNFTTTAPINLVDLMATNPYGKIKFRWNNRDWFGYFIDGGIDPADNDKQTWKLLSAPENDLEHFNLS